MKMIAITVTLAVVLGVAVMLAPILAFMYVYPVTIPLNGTGSPVNRENNQSTSQPVGNEVYGENNKSSDVLGGNGVGNESTSQGNQADKYNLYRSPLSVAEAAQIYGAQDVGPDSFPSSILHLVLVTAACSIVAFGASFYFRRKNSQV
jgi:hypothetical protein